MERAGGDGPVVGRSCHPRREQRKNSEQAPHSLAQQPPRTALTKGWQ